ncbi:hypothetical protein [Cyanobium sp. ULC084]
MNLVGAPVVIEAASLSLVSILPTWHHQLQRWSLDGSLREAATEALLLTGTQSLLETTIAAWGAGQFGDLPPVRLLEGSWMPGAAGAYAISTGTIYLNACWLSTASSSEALAVLTEELGHHLDGLLNSEETPGDEGEHFSLLLLRRVPIPPERLEALRTEDDHGTILVDGALIEVEMATIIGTLGDDNLVGSSGSDTISGLLGADTIDGGAGSDTLIIDYSANFYAGPLPPAGIISGLFDPAAPSLSGFLYAYNSVGALDEIEFTNIERFQITGTGANDQITTGSGNDTILAGAGDDTIDAGGGINSIDGGSGFDILTIANFSTATAALTITNLNNSIVLPTGTWTVNSIEQFTSLSTGSGADTISLTGRANDTIATNGGNDTINAGLGFDIVDGGTGTDLLILDYSSDPGIPGLAYDGAGVVLYDYAAISQSGYGNNYSFGISPETINFSNIERFLIVGTNYSGIGNGDNINDYFNTGIGNDTITALDGNDYIDAGGGANRIDGGNGNDTLVSGSGNDTILGGSGEDFIDVGGGINRVDGGSGFDTLANANFSTAAAALTITNLNNSIVLPTGTWTVNNIEAFTSLSTGSGADTLAFTARGNDTIATNGGNDTINAGLGIDIVDGGTNTDLLIVDYSSNTIPGTGLSTSINDPSLVNLSGNFFAYYDTFGNYDQVQFSNIEQFRVTGTGVDDSIATGNGNDTILGGAGNDIINARGGINSIDGGEGFDTLAEANFSTATAAVTITNLSNSIVLPTGTWTVNNIEAFTSLSTGSAADTIAFTVRGNDNIITNGGNDTINAGLGIDNVDGGTNTDLLIVDYSNNAYSGIVTSISDPSQVSLSGYFYAYYNASNPYDNVNFSNIEQFRITGTGVGDSIETGNGNDTILGGAGNDTINARGGINSIDGGEGFDTLAEANFSTATAAVTITNLSNSIVLPTGTWTVNNIEAFTSLSTGSAADTIAFTVRGNDNIITNGGNDTINAGLGIDNVDGGTNTDLLIVDYSNNNNGGISTAINDPSQVGLSGYFYAYYNASNPYDNVNFSNIEQFRITGTGVGDSIETGNGNDTILGGAGNDTINARGGINSIDGGEGFDTLAEANFSTATAAVTITNLSNSIVLPTGTWTVNNIEAFTSLSTGSAADTIAFTVRGNDTIATNGGNDTINAGLGIDNVDGGTGTGDLLIVNYSSNTYFNPFTSPTSGISMYFNDPALASLSGQITAYYSTAYAFDQVSFSNIERFQITGTAAKDIIFGGSGNDTLNGGLRADTLTGGNGSDIYVVDNVGDMVVETNASLASGGADQVLSSVSYTLNDNVENLTLTGVAAINGTGNTLANAIIGNSAANNLKGGADSLNGADGIDTLTGGDGNDTYTVRTVGDLIIESNADSITGGVDGVLSSLANYTLTANVENLTLTGSANSNGTGNSLDNNLLGNIGNNSLDGLAGNDSLDGALGADTLTGGDGNDTYIVDNIGDVVVESNADSITGGIDTVLSSAATHTLTANVENLTLTGGAPINGTGNSLNNSLLGNTGNNSLDGLAGIDSLDGAAGADTLTGGDGNDTYTVDDIGDVVVETNADSITGGIDTVLSSAATHTLTANVENLILTGGAPSSGTGNSLANAITGNGFANSLKGGDDSLLGVDGIDTLTGGDGNDTYTVATVGDLVVEITADAVIGGTDEVKSSLAAYTLTANVENLTLEGAGISGTGNSLANVITGNLAANSFTGGGGNDTLIGGAGNDTYLFDADLVLGADTLNEAGGGIDTLNFSATSTRAINLSLAVATIQVVATTNLSLILGLASTFENLIGGSLADTLTGNSLANSLTGGGGSDTLTGAANNDTYLFDADLALGADILNEDGGGIDSLDFTATTTIAVNVDLSLATIQVVNGNLSLTLGSATNFENLIGGALGDTLTGNSQANSLIGGGTGIDTLTGGNGNDTYTIETVGDLVVETNADSITGGIDRVLSSLAAYTLTDNVENLTLAPVATALSGTGNSLANAITGNAFANSLKGGADSLLGVDGIDTLTGGDGNDTYTVAAGDIVVETNAAAAGGTDTVLSSLAAYTLTANVENLTLTGLAPIDGTGNSGRNAILGNEAANILKGGDDSLNGVDGIDTLTGGNGNDTYTVATIGDLVVESNADAVLGGTDTVRSSLAAYTLTTNVENLILTGAANITGTGNSLGNIITGNDGENLLNGAGGNDTLTGGLGKDTYRFASTLDASTNIDSITNFDIALGEIIQLENSFFTAPSLAAAGTLAASAFFVGAAATTADQRILYDSTIGSLLYDRDGTGAIGSIAFATLTPDLALTNTFFTIT